jgi:acetyl-CoA carboxylase biotin carboxyl carrier protein
MARKEILSPVTGIVWKVEAAAGSAVEEGSVVIFIESMKMEVPIEATTAATVVEILVAEGDSVDQDQVVAIIET